MPIISPVYIYLMSSLDGVKSMFGWFILISILCAIAMFFVLMIASDSSDDEFRESMLNSCKKHVKTIIVSFCISMVGYAIVPDKQTVIQMAVANLITVDNVKMGTEAVERVYNDIMEVVKGKTSEEKK